MANPPINNKKAAPQSKVNNSGAQPPNPIGGMNLGTGSAGPKPFDPYDTDPVYEPPTQPGGGGTGPVILNPQPGDVAQLGYLGLNPGVYKFTIKTEDHFGGITYHNFHVEVKEYLTPAGSANVTFAQQGGLLNSEGFKTSFASVLGQNKSL